ncbi:MAG: CaiB/BaiF CoA-transferase family protein [Tissierellia bacterium]|nr:CaiB/BaiF CoA-transferase family protein [Tissierellia bacterium]
MLKNLKILDFSTLLPGPFASWRLGELGADIIKIAAPNKVDLVIENSPEIGQGVRSVDAWLNHNKTDIRYINLKEKEGVDEVKRLILEEGYDIIIETNRPGIMTKLGLGYEDIKKIKDDIIYVSITGFGQDGLRSNKATHDLNAIALSGLADYSGTVESGPTHQAYQTSDILAAHNAIIGLLSAVNNRAQTGKGSHVDVAMLDSLIPLHAMIGTAFLAGDKEPKREDNWVTGASVYDYYKTKDDKYMSLGSLEPKFWNELCRQIGKEEWIEAGAFSEDWQPKKEYLKEMFSSKTRDEWIELLTTKDICIEPVLSAKEALFEDPGIQDRKLTKEIEFKGYKTRVLSEPIKFL